MKDYNQALSDINEIILDCWQKGLGKFIALERVENFISLNLNKESGK